MKTLLLALLLLTNVCWFCYSYDMQADYDQEMGLRDQSDTQLRSCEAKLAEALHLSEIN